MIKNSIKNVFMNEKQLAHLLKYSSSNELYVVTWNNVLVVLTCPFKVLAKQNIGLIFKDQIVLVAEVKITRDLRTVYVIKGMAYYYYHFEILYDSG